MSLSDHTQPAPHDSTTAEPIPAAPAAADPLAGLPLPAPVDFTKHVEIVSRGILFSLLAIPLGVLATVLIWKLGFIASITGFLVAGVAGFLYVKGATTAPRKGVVPLIAVILVGVAASFYAIIGADLVEFYNTPEGQSLGYPSAFDFVSKNLFDGDLLSEYRNDLVMFLVFAALGVFSTVRRLLGARKAF